MAMHIMKVRSIIQRSPHGIHTHIIINRPGKRLGFTINNILNHPKSCLPSSFHGFMVMPSLKKLQNWVCVQPAKQILFIDYPKINFSGKSNDMVTSMFLCTVISGFLQIYCDKVITNIVFPCTFFHASNQLSFLHSPCCDCVFCTAGLGSHVCRDAYNHRAKKTEIVVISTLPTNF